MKNKFKFLSIILVVLLLIAALPLSAFAEEIEDTEIENETETVEETAAEEDATAEGNYIFSLPEGDENTHYERVSRNVVKVTVYPNVTEEETTLVIPPIDGQINLTDPIGGAEPMVVIPGNDEIIFDGGNSATYPADTFISSAAPTTNYGSATEASVSSSKYMYISYPMPYIPEYATIIEATLNLKYRYKANQSATIYAHKINIDWNDDTLTWNTAAQYTGMGFDQTAMSSVTITDTQGVSLNTPGSVQIDILDAAEDWHIDATENHGIALTGSSKNVAIKTSEADVAYRPYFEYFYTIPNPIDDGTYYIHNIENQQYVDIENCSVSYGAAIELNSFSCEDSQQWILTSGEDGYYTIKSAYSNKYIGVDINDGQTVKQYTSVNDYAKWAALGTSSGNYMLKCKAYEDEDLVLATVTPQNIEGGNLFLMNYTDNDDYGDEWELNEFEYSFTLHHYYDHGYDERFSDADKTALEKIQSYHNAVAERLLQIFGVIVYFECDTEPFNSSADHCKWLKHNDDYLDYINIVEDCTHGSDSKPNIHLTRTAIYSENFPVSNILTPVIWTGYIMPTEGYQTSVTFDKESIVMTPYYTTDKTEVDNIYVNKEESEVIWNSIYSLLHEVGHTLGALDHTICKEEDAPCIKSNCDRCVHGLTVKRDCIMACKPRIDISEITNEAMFCQDCLQIIRNHLADHHQSNGG